MLTYYKVNLNLPYAQMCGIKVDPNQNGVIVFRNFDLFLEFIIF